MAKKKRGADQLAVQNAVKTLLANIRFASVDDPIRSIVLTSAIPNEGKSTVSMNLAQAFATSGKRTLLVECDLRRRSLADMMGLHARAGMYAVLTDQAPLSSAVVRTDTPGLDFLDVEPHIPNPVDVVSSKRFARLARAMEQEYDFVVYDTPPVGTFVEAAIISTLADATLLVVRDNFTKRSEVQAAYEQLQKAEANVIGVVLNQCAVETSEYYYAYYTNDGKRVKTSEAAASASSAPGTARTAVPGKARGRRGAGSF